MCVGKNKDLFIYFSMLQIIFVLDHAVELSQNYLLFLNWSSQTNITNFTTIQCEKIHDHPVYGTRI